MRASIKDQLYCFREYSGCLCYFVNLSVAKFPDFLKNVNFDLIIFHTTLLSDRFAGSRLESAKGMEFICKELASIEHLKQSDTVKIALPQDEWFFIDAVNYIINEFGINFVCTVAPESEWKKIFYNVDFAKVKFAQVLTGYLAPETLKEINSMEEKIKEKTIDIGYRARKSPYCLGRLGFLKTTIADVFSTNSKKYALKTDISLKEEDTFLGSDWYEFLLKCKYIIGVEGGASLMDKDGTIWERTNNYLKQHPNAEFEEVESEIFPGMDGKLHNVAISPRHLECCATKSCQILVEGEYNGILKPDIHYIPVKMDFSNIDEVLQTVADDDRREAIVDAAYRDIVSSGKYTYKSYVELIIKESLPLGNNESKKLSNKEKLLYYVNILREFLNMRKIQAVAVLLKHFPSLRNTLFKLSMKVKK
ncbi:MAG: hypothetical protein HW421_1315 [Ignavibacteria bacterium]|nr:hypothetical protein [Ignavibacteria bacterium]